MPDDVVPVDGDAPVVGDAAHQVGAGREQPPRPARLAGVAGVLDAHGEVVRARAVLLAAGGAVERAVVAGADVPGLAVLVDQLADLAAVVVDDIVGAHARPAVGEPAPAARVAALAGVDHDHRRRARAARRPRRGVGGGSPDDPRAVGAAALGAGRAEARLDVLRSQHGDLGGHALLQRPVDALVDVVGLAVLQLDVADVGHGLGPHAQIRAVEGVGGRGVEHGGVGADVGAAPDLHHVRVDVEQPRGQLHPVEGQAHDADERGLVFELDRGLDHLPAGVLPSDGLEQRRGDVELVGRLLNLVFEGGGRLVDGVGVGLERRGRRVGGLEWGAAPGHEAQRAEDAHSGPLHPSLLLRQPYQTRAPRGFGSMSPGPPAAGAPVW